MSVSNGGKAPSKKGGLSLSVLEKVGIKKSDLPDLLMEMASPGAYFAEEDLDESLQPCSHCQHLNPESAVYCARCYKALH